LDQLALSLMALEKWGYEYRFQTRFYTTSHRSGQRLTGANRQAACLRLPSIGHSPKGIGCPG
jgi:hypothetical protein